MILPLWRRSLRVQSRQLSGLLHFAVPERLKDFEDFAPSRKGTAIVALVLIHGLHEGNLIIRVFTLAGGRVDLAAAFAVFPRFGGIFLADVLAALQGHGDAALAAFDLFAIRSGVLAHRRRPHKNRHGRVSRPSWGAKSRKHAISALLLLA